MPNLSTKQLREARGLVGGAPMWKVEVGWMTGVPG